MNTWIRDSEAASAPAERPTLGLGAAAPEPFGPPALTTKAAPVDLSLADGASGAHTFPVPGRAPENSDSAGGPHDLGVLPAPAVRAARICSRSFPTNVRPLSLAGGVTDQHAGGSESTGHSSHRPRAARSCSTSTAFGAHPIAANASATADRAFSVIAPAHTGNGAPA